MACSEFTTESDFCAQCGDLLKKGEYEFGICRECKDEYEGGNIEEVPEDEE